MALDREGLLARYAAERARRDRATAPADPRRLGRLARRLIGPRISLAARRTATRLLAPYSALRARRLARSRPLKLNLASGSSRLEGWINVDLAGSGADLAWLIGRPLPFPDASCDAIFVEHFFEHLELLEAIALAAELRRLLAPGGVARVGVPDFGRYAAAYLGSDPLIERYRPARPTPLLALSEVAYLHGHRSLWDEATLVTLLVEAGFEGAAARPFGESAIDPAPDSPPRRTETLYVEGVR